LEWIVVSSIGFFSLLMGSFLAVVVYRLPLILHYQWQSDNQQSMHYEKPVTHSFNLLLPASHCPDCQHTLRFFEKLPVCAYLFLRGKCAYCQHKIHPRYLLVETLTLICSSIVAYRFHGSVQLLAALILTWGLIVLSGIDCEQYLLPDVLVLPLLWLGLNLNVFYVFVSPVAAILGASVAYLSLWTLAKGYGYLAKKEVMGQGDFKCFAMLGAWLGVNALINILLMASLLGAVVGCVLLIKGKSSLQKPIPFGPFLAIAGWLTLLR
jgi:leader peptidase (prepilin peptidase) / N-methyltransferase